MRSVMIVLDSMNRRFLQAYGNDWVHTPNIARLAARAAVFDNHWCGSLPCMPARRDMMTGRLGFLEAPWGPVEPFDDCLPVELRKRGVYSHIITDHYHYFQAHGVHYNTLFDSWEFERGQEGDPWIPQVRDPEVPVYYGKNRRQDWVNRQVMQKEEAYSGPRCFQRAVEFLARNHAEDDWHLHLEVFDPHEPFYVPESYRELYGDDWDEFHFDWPNYEAVKQSPAAVEHVRKLYAALLTMTDRHLGRFLDKMDEHDLWRDTLVILTTDHGILLGEHGYWMKNYMPVFNEIAHIPLMVYRPGAANNGKRIGSLTSTIDLMPTLLEWHGAARPPHVIGHSLLGLLEVDAPVREGALFGYFGRAINVTDGRFTYFREPRPGRPLYKYTAHTTDALRREDGRKQYAAAEMGRFLPHGYDIPVYRVPAHSSSPQGAEAFDALYDLSADYAQLHPIDGGPEADAMATLMQRLMREAGAPEEQFARVGLEGA